MSLVQHKNSSSLIASETYASDLQEFKTQLEKLKPSSSALKWADRCQVLYPTEAPQPWELDASIIWSILADFVKRVLLFIAFLFIFGLLIVRAIVFH